MLVFPLDFKTLIKGLSSVLIIFIPCAAMADEIQQRPDRTVLGTPLFRQIEPMSFVWQENSNFTLCSVCPSRQPLELLPKKPVMSIKVSELDQTSQKDSKPDVFGSTDQQALQDKQAPVKQVLTVYFGFNSSKLSPSELEKLKTFPFQKTDSVRIYGYTCDIGSENYNMKLSLKRAKAVAKEISTMANVVEVVGRGECCLKETRPLSRRVEIIVEK